VVVCGCYTSRTSSLGAGARKMTFLAIDSPVMLFILFLLGRLLLPFSCEYGFSPLFFRGDWT